ncbi:MAG: YbaK/EbsC family protein [Betaproteobacteria bacterium]|nr:YbaK/EbsC family protein [Betaproteobacteria bacterium]
MSIAPSVQKYLDAQGIAFEVLTHAHTASSLRSADRSAIDPGCLAKAVLFGADLESRRLLMAVVPATHRVALAEFAGRAKCSVHLATEDDAARAFGDCERGAIPPLGPAYGVETIWDDRLMAQPDLYFEAGDHEHLVHVTAQDFLRLLPGCTHGQISHPR